MFDHWGKVDGKVACAFSPAGGWGGGAEIACQSLQVVLVNFGLLVFGVTDYAGKVTTCHYGAVAAKAPREAGVADACRLLGRRLAEWVAVVVDGRKDPHPLAKPALRTLPGCGLALKTGDEPVRYTVGGVRDSRGILLHK